MLQNYDPSSSSLKTIDDDILIYQKLKTEILKIRDNESKQAQELGTTKTELESLKQALLEKDAQISLWKTKCGDLEKTLKSERNRFTFELQNVIQEKDREKEEFERQEEEVASQLGI